MKNHYLVLGLSPSATPADIKKAFRKIALEFHPDKNPGNKKAEEKFKEASEANEILSNDVKRKEYDLALQQEQLREQQAKQAAYNAQQEAARRSAQRATDVTQQPASSGISFGQFLFGVGLTVIAVGIAKAISDDEK
ncbi:MAG TPA: DnaJ domain-containing protein [Chitinophagales bacterium]|nr:DnaJ domain-containing protein [Chitinophagales bacterium]